MDTLFLLDHEFEDSALPRRRFYCRDCILVEGLLAKFPERTGNLNVVRLPYPRPRQAVVDAIGEENQWLPVLVLDHPGGEREPPRFINDIRALLAALHERHGFPEPHP